MMKAWKPKIDEFDEFVGEVRSEFRIIDVRLTKLEARIDSMNNVMATSMATKADLAVLESTMLKWFIATTITMVGLGFAAAKLLH